MSKAYKGKACVYCTTPNSAVAPDHVVARKFFLKEHRDNLPKVPVCVTCNTVKSELELYAMSVMPFAGRHPDSSRNLLELVPQRLAKNARLKSALQAGMARNAQTSSDGYVSSALTLPLDGEKIEKLFRLIAQGLCFWHWGILLPKDQFDVQGGYLTQRGQVEFDKLIGMTTNDPALGNLGDGTFLYEGVKVPNIEGTTIWRMTLYGSVVSNQLLPTDLQTSTAHVSTAQRGKCLYYFDND